MARWKFDIGDEVVVNDRGPEDYRGRKGSIVSMGPAKGKYTVKINGEWVYLHSWSLDLALKRPK